MTDPYIGINGTKIDFFDNEVGAVRTLKQLTDGTYALTYSSGWIPAATFTYAAAFQITVASGAASIYQKGDKIKFTQQGIVKYMYIITVADTYLIVTAGTDFAVADTATYPITLPYYSHVENPLGFQHWFNTAAPTFDVAGYDNGSGGQPTTAECRFKISGKQCSVHYKGNGVKAGTNTDILFNPASAFAPAANTTSNTLIGNGGFYITAWLNLVCTLAYATLAVLSAAANIADNAVIANLTFTLNFEI